MSTVADMGYGLPLETAMRSCVVGVALAREIGLPERETADAFYASLLAHIGCVGFSHEMSTAFGDDHQANRAGARTNFADPRDVFATLIPETMRGMSPSSRIRAGAFIVARGRGFGRRYDTATCEVARETARRIGLAESVQHALYQIREWWNGRGAPRGLRGDAIVAPARVARVASEAVLFDGLGGAEYAVAALERRAGGTLDPSIVAAFVAGAPSLLAEASDGDPRERLLSIEPAPVAEIDIAELPVFAAAFGDLADLKTPSMHGHSREVARLSIGAGQRLGLSVGVVAQLEVAALLHDIGRVGVSNAVWEKEGSLTASEWEQVRLHPYYSERILSASPVLAPMAAIAARHHERLDGSGYHRASSGHDLSAAARVLAVADAFQAMTQPRPYREALDPERASRELRACVARGEFDADAVDAVVETAGLSVGAQRRRPRPAQLTDREVEVLRLVARACSNREVAERLHISRRTAEHHIQHVYAKIGVASRSAAALFALENDLLNENR